MKDFILRLSRREMILGAVGSLVGCAATATGVQSMDAATPLGADASLATLDGGPDSANVDVTGGQGDAARVPIEDIPLLNAQLTAEYAAIAAYTVGLSILESPPSEDPLASSALTLAAIATQWRSHHNSHANALAAAIVALGGIPVSEATVIFTPPAEFTPSVINVLKIACNLEKGVAIAYNTAIGNLSAAANRFLASTIEGDETQHFIVLYSLVNSLAVLGAGIPAEGTSNVVPYAFIVAPPGSTGMGLDGLTPFPYT